MDNDDHLLPPDQTLGYAPRAAEGNQEAAGTYISPAKTFALELSIKLASDSESAAEIVSRARIFETYLVGTGGVEVAQ